MNLLASGTLACSLDLLVTHVGFHGENNCRVDSLVAQQMLVIAQEEKRTIRYRLTFFLAIDNPLDLKV
jgi:hypothetical protein